MVLGFYWIVFLIDSFFLVKEDVRVRMGEVGIYGLRKEEVVLYNVYVSDRMSEKGKWWCLGCFMFFLKFMVRNLSCN